MEACHNSLFRVHADPTNHKVSDWAIIIAWANNYICRDVMPIGPWFAKNRSKVIWRYQMTIVLKRISFLFIAIYFQSIYPGGTHNILNRSFPAEADLSMGRIYSCAWILTSIIFAASIICSGTVVVNRLSCIRLFGAEILIAPETVSL